MGKIVRQNSDICTSFRFISQKIFEEGASNFYHKLVFTIIIIIMILKEGRDIFTHYFLHLIRKTAAQLEQIRNSSCIGRAV